MRRSIWTATRRSLGCLLAALAACAVPAGAGQNPCASLQRVGPVPSGDDLVGVASGNGLTLALGLGGTILTSPDSMTWTLRDPGTPAVLSGAAWGAGRWVVVGGSGTVLLSHDGKSFSGQRSGVTADLTGVTFGAGRFVVVGTTGAVLTSPDGVTWAARQIPGVRHLFSVTWNGSVFVAGGMSTSLLATLLTSSDGLTWETRWTHFVANSEVRSVSWDGGGFVAVGVQFQNVLVATSSDGATWTSPTIHQEQALWSVAGSGSVWLAVGSSGVILRSTDGLSWVKLVDPVGWVAGQLNAITWTGEEFVAVGATGGIVTTVDGLTWKAASAHLLDVASNGASYVAAGSDILWSADGLAWERSVWQHRSTDSLIGVTAYPGGYLAVGISEGIGAVLRSTDGRTWDRSASFGVSPTAVVWGGDRFVAVGYQGFVATSPDGVEWTVRNAGVRSNFVSVTWDGARFYALAPSFSGASARSRDGVTWETFDSSALGDRRIVWTGTELAAVGLALATSADGDHWDEGFLDVYGPSYVDVVRAGDSLLAVGGTRGTFWGAPWFDVALATSSNGRVWRVHACTETTPNGLRRVAAGPGGWVAVGAGTSIIHGAGGSGSWLVPTAAHLQGSGGTQWRTDLTVANLGPTQAGYSLELLRRDQPNPAPVSKSFTLAPGVSAGYPDLVDGVFGHAGAAALRLGLPDGAGLLATSRTYNQTPGGTYGQDVPVVRDEDAIGAGQVGVLQQLEQSAGFRTNLGLVNMGAGPIVVTVELFDAAAVVLGSFDVELRAFEPRQVDRVFTRVTRSAVEDGVIRVFTTTAGGRFVAFASVVDNVSGDPVLTIAR